MSSVTHHLGCTNLIWCHHSAHVKAMKEGSGGTAILWFDLYCSTHPNPPTGTPLNTLFLLMGYIKLLNHWTLTLKMCPHRYPRPYQKWHLKPVTVNNFLVWAVELLIITAWAGEAATALINSNGYSSLLWMFKDPGHYGVHHHWTAWEMSALHHLRQVHDM